MQRAIEDLEQALDKHNILVIEGLSGVGKSMLAARFAKRVRKRFDDRVAWISLNQGEERLSNKFLFEFDVDSKSYSQHPIVNYFAYSKLRKKPEKYVRQCHNKAAEFYEKLLNEQSGKATLEVVQNYIERHHHYRQTGDLEKTIETALDSFDELRILAKELLQA
ncbi:MAG: hypothetical protein GY749_05265 [Desulfobacteraceae bacterium]|nr:hypothetical protein [Desulfobacteraceae bacterium]